jgi:putative ABC transport system permease protein
LEIRIINMNLIEIIEESISVLRTNKLRTALSALGIIIGIGSVIALMTLGQASQLSVRQRIQSLGSNLLTIRPGNQQQGFLRGSNSSNKTLKLSDAEAIIQSNRVTTVDSVASEYSSRIQVSYERNNTNVQVSGVTENYFKIRNIEIDLGNSISLTDNINVSKVAVLGTTVVTDLFGENVNPLGKGIRINGISYTVTGVTKSKGAGGFNSSDEAIFVPLTTAQKILFGVNYISTIYVTAKSEDVMEAAKNQLGFFLLELHKKVSSSEADFSISSQEDILETANQITGTFTTLLTGIAAISLVVGGIGIMNIMLVTVTERTSEIGLRKALGAKRKTIISQFLVESVVLTITGGLIGVVAGIITSLILTKTMSLPSAISIQSILLAVTVSCVIGIIFGWYPAFKASKLQPIEALRYE